MIVERLRNRGQQARSSVQFTDGSFTQFLDFNTSTAAGQKVDEDTVLSLAAAYRAVSFLSGLFASAPVVVRNKSSNAPVRNRLLESPSPVHTPYELWELMATWVLLRGNAYALKTYKAGPGSAVEALSPIAPTQVTVKAVVNKQGAIVDRVYTVHTAAGHTLDVPSEDMLHVMDMSKDGIVGLSRIALQREAFSTALATDKFAGKLFGSGSLMSGILTTDKRLDQATADRIRDRWRQRMQGVDNAHDIAILDAGAKFESLTIPPEDAQFLQARRYGVAEVARIFGVPRWALMDEGGSTFGSDLEGVGAGLERYTLAPFAARFDSRITADLLPRSQTAEHDFSHLSVPNPRTRASAAIMWRNSNVKSINDIRIEEGLGRIDDPRYDDPLYAPPKDSTPGVEQGENTDQPMKPAPTEQDPTVDIQDQEET